MRYIGSKIKLINDIHDTIYKAVALKRDSVFCDMFSGTGVVAESFKTQCNLIINDNLYACFCVSKAKILNTAGFFSGLGFDPFVYFNNADATNYTAGFCYNNFAPRVSGRQYFSDENAKFIDFIRDTIDIWYNDRKINKDEKDYLVGCLIESVSKVSNVAGVYSAYLHIWDPRALKRMEYVKIESAAPSAGNNRYFELNANDLIDRISGDVLYLDPPYTSTQYISQYHVLETINRIVCDLLKYLSAANAAELYKKIVSCIKKYGLSKGNKAAYAKLRTDYNSKNISERDPLLLYLLICYGFEHQIRFNTRLEFNNPCGNSGFNDEMYEKLITFNRRCKNLNIIFKSGDYQAYVDQLNSGDFVCCDPPYLSTCGVYTDERRDFNGWDKNQQRDLTVFLEKLHDKNIRFMLSNYTEHADGDNDELLHWAKANNFKIIYNGKLTKRNRRDRRELIIINY